MCLRVSYKKKNFFGIFKVTEERSRIRSRIRNRILKSEIRIHGNRSGSAPKCNGYLTLIVMIVIALHLKCTTIQRVPLILFAVTHGRPPPSCRADQDSSIQL
jgi:hypothetical protein